MSYVQAGHPCASNFSHFSPLFSFHFSSCLHPKFEFQKLSILSSFPLCLPLPDALLCSFLNPDCASSTAITPPCQLDKSGLGLVGLPQNPQISFHLYHPHSALCSKHFSKVVFLKFIFKKSICFLRVFLGNGKSNGCGIMLVISSKFGIL